MLHHNMAPQAASGGRQLAVIRLSDDKRTRSVVIGWQCRQTDTGEQEVQAVIRHGSPVCM